MCPFPPIDQTNRRQSKDKEKKERYMLNKVALIGYIGQDPKVSQLADGSYKVYFTLATTERPRRLPDGTETPERTEWHNIVCANRVANIARQYLHKGSLVYVEGKLHSQQYEGKDGIKRIFTGVQTERFIMLDKPAQ